VIWISDLHLGQLHGPRFARKVADIVNTLSPDIIFIGGDLFDGTGAPDAGELTLPLRTLAAPLGTYFITGNHEEFGDATPKFLVAVAGAGMHILQDEMTEIDGLQIIGVDYKNAVHRDQFKKILEHLPIDREKPSILLKHEPKDLDVAEATGISLQISGHTHRAQIWPFEYIASLVYKGYVYGLKAHGKMQVYTSSGVGTWGPPVRVGTDSEIVVLSFSESKAAYAVR
jgi:predicted MPP superfamily phosphohydrolase